MGAFRLRSRHSKCRYSLLKKSGALIAQALVFAQSQLVPRPARYSLNALITPQKGVRTAPFVGIAAASHRCGIALRSHHIAYERNAHEFSIPEISAALVTTCCSVTRTTQRLRSTSGNG
jgi:hypothetical protein